MDGGAALGFEAFDNFGVEDQVDVDDEVEQDENVQGLMVKIGGGSGLAEEAEPLQRDGDGDDRGDGKVDADARSQAQQSDAYVNEIAAEYWNEIAGELFAVGGDEQKLRESGGIGQGGGCQPEEAGYSQEKGGLEELKCGDENYGDWPVYSVWPHVVMSSFLRGSLLPVCLPVVRPCWSDAETRKPLQRAESEVR